MVYLVTTESFPNGMAASQRLRGYAKGLAQLGERCEVLCVNRLEDPAAPLGNAEPRGELEGYAFRYLGGSTRRPSGARQPESFLPDLYKNDPSGSVLRSNSFPPACAAV